MEKLLLLAYAKKVLNQQIKVDKSFKMWKAFFWFSCECELNELYIENNWL